MTPQEALRRHWFPVAASSDAPSGHIAHALLLGQEIALWRDETGRLRAWDNRCPHRGVRLTIGDNLGATLRCRYHGYRFAADTGHCVDMPAHPGQAAPRAMRVAAFPCHEASGLAWVRLAAEGEAFQPLPPSAAMPGRAVPRDLPLATIATRLATAGAVPAPPPGPQAPHSPTMLRLGEILLLLQPAAAEETWIHSLFPDTPDEAALRRHEDWLAEAT